jgi:hypothetical protein
MADDIPPLVERYQRLVSEFLNLSPCGYGRNPIGSDGVDTKLFLAFFATNQDLLLQFLKDIRLVRFQMMCSKCGSSMTWVSCPHRPDGYIWRCRKGPRTSRCSHVTSIRHGSWFHRSYLSLSEVLLLTYDIMRRIPIAVLRLEYRFSSKTVSDWTMFCREAMLIYMRQHSSNMHFLVNRLKHTIWQPEGSISSRYPFPKTMPFCDQYVVSMQIVA